MKPQTMKSPQMAWCLPSIQELQSRNQAGTAPMRDNDKDDSGTWLITLADLMTMLLVFALIMFATFTAYKTSPQPQAPAAPPSMVAEALANTRSHAGQHSSVEIPLRMRTIAPPPMEAGADERVICRILLNFTDNALALQPDHQAELGHFARLSRQNPGAKVIISSSMNGQTFSRAINAMNYLVSNCSLPKQNIFLQSIASPDPPEPGLIDHAPVEARLVKAFW